MEKKYCYFERNVRQKGRKQPRSRRRAAADYCSGGDRPISVPILEYSIYARARDFDGGQGNTTVWIDSIKGCE